MIILILCLSLLVVLVIGAIKLQTWESGMHMINFEWGDGTEKFKLISRWGIME